MEINTSISSVRLTGSKQITLSPSTISTKKEPKIQMEFRERGGQSLVRGALWASL